MKVIIKIKQAIEKIKSSDLKKSGRNTFSNYDYYTPEQVDKLVTEACKELRLFNKFELIRDEFGLNALMTVIDLESQDKEVYNMATDIPVMTASNAAQHLGGAVTYSRRYLLMNIYDIVDNNLDFDADKKPKKESQPIQPESPEPDKWLNKWRDKDKTLVFDSYNNLIVEAKEKGIGVKELREFYKISKEMAAELEKDLNL